MRLLGLGVVGCLAASAFAQDLLRTSFEPSFGYSLGSLHNQQGWLDNGSGATVSNLHAQGTQSVRLAPTSSDQNSNFRAPVVFTPTQSAPILRFQWSSYANLDQIQAIHFLHTTYGADLKSGGQVLAGIRVDGGTDVVQIWNPVSLTYDDTDSILGRGNWAEFSISLNPITGNASYWLDGQLVAGDVPSGTAAVMDNAMIVLDDPGQDVFYVDTVIATVLPERPLRVLCQSVENYGMVNLPAQVQFLKSDGTEVSTVSSAVGVGRWVTTTSPDVVETLQVKVKPKGHLSQIVGTIDPQSLSNTQLAGNFIPGDINNDDVIDIADYTELALSFDHNLLDPDWLTPRSNGVAPADADINFDGLVDVADYTVLSTYFDLAP